MFRHKASYVERLVKGANACLSYKERKAFCDENNVRMDNLRRMAAKHGLKVNDPEPEKAAKFRKAAKKRWGGKGKKRGRPLNRTIGTPGHDELARIGLYLATTGSQKVVIGKAILQLEIVLDSLRKAVE